MPMPQYQYMLIFLVVVAVMGLRRAIARFAQDAKRARETGEAYRRAQENRQAFKPTQPPAAAPVPTPFQEAAPYQYQPVEKPREAVPSRGMAGRIPAEQTKITREELEQERDKRAAERRVIAPAKAAAPRPQVMPQLSGASLVQAVITKEILTRPPSARRPYKGWNRRQHL